MPNRLIEMRKSHGLVLCERTKCEVTTGNRISEEGVATDTDEKYFGLIIQLYCVLCSISISYYKLLAPSGVAAYLIGGTTLHNFSALNIQLNCWLQCDTLQVARLDKTDTLVTDEFSMFDCCLFRTTFVGAVSQRLLRVTDGVAGIIAYPSCFYRTKNRQFVFVKYKNYQAVAVAWRKLMGTYVKPWGHPPSCSRQLGGISFLIGNPAQLPASSHRDIGTVLWTYRPDLSLLLNPYTYIAS